MLLNRRWLLLWVVEVALHNLRIPAAITILFAVDSNHYVCVRDENVHCSYSYPGHNVDISSCFRSSCLTGWSSTLPLLSRWGRLTTCGDRVIDWSIHRPRSIGSAADLLM